MERKEKGVEESYDFPKAHGEHVCPLGTADAHFVSRQREREKCGNPLCVPPHLKGGYIYFFSVRSREITQSLEADAIHYAARNDWNGVSPKRREGLARMEIRRPWKSLRTPSAT
jgi:hypothetical protein